MSRQFAYVPPMIAAVVGSLTITMLLMPGGPALAAETCIAAPTSSAPPGSHWFYRVDHASQRKCWHLAQADRRTQSTASRAAPQREPAAGTDAAAVTEKSADRLPESGMQPAPAWITKSASAVTPQAAAPLQQPNPFDRVSERADDQGVAPDPVSVAQGQASNTADRPISRSRTEEPIQQANIVSENAAAAPPASAGRTQFVFVALAGIGFLAAAVFFLVGVRRRRADVLTAVARADIPASEMPDSSDSPTFSPMAPMSLIPQHDDVEETLQRQPRRRLAA